ncbi:MAG TPA: type II secretion system F family protein, partial [Candidatus Sulfotelmatobacter sp.]|nr:type II secretion system F family protein [Candidatus Sulfotelmatobacter sp.]
LITGLEAISEQLRNSTFRLSIQRVKREIEGGSSFSDALDRQKKFYSPLIVNMIRAGEKAGILPSVLERISSLLEYDMKTADQIKAATRYPLIVLYTMIGGVLALNVWVLPRFAVFFANFKMELPLPTKILMGTNYIITTYWYWFIALFVSGGYLIRRVMETEAGRYNYDRLILQVPVLGELFRKMYLSRFGRMLAAMLGSGIPILEALTITANTVDNRVISRIIIGIRDEVSQGQTLAVPMRGSGIFPPISISMVAIGEKVGMLETMLNKMADYFDREVAYTVANLTPLLEPLMIFGLALMLLVFALGVFLPMWNVVNIYKAN